MKKSILTSLSLSALLLLAVPSFAYTAYKTVSFGAAQTGQAVTYTVKDNTNTAVTTGVSGTVVELGGGTYGAAITVPDGANYFVVWSETNTGTTYLASDRIEAPATSAVATLTNQTTLVSGQNTILTATQANGTNITTANTNISSLNTLATTGAGVKIAAGQAIASVSGSVGSVTGSVGSVTSPVALSTGDEIKIGLVGTDTAGVTTLLARPAQTGDAFGLVNPLIASGKFTASALSLAPVTPSGGTVTGYATGQDPATLLASSFAAIPAAVGNYNVGGTAGMLTARASSAISSSVAAGSYLAGSINTVAHTQTIIYYLPGTTLAAMNAGTATVINTALLTLDTTNTKIQSRVNTPGTF